MADLTTRAGKGSPLTNAEVDANFTNLNTDKVETGLAALDAYDTTIADTAVDVFVYDTSRDSDGGAWRHRTQHTSWYNETLNTATRGSRREFPAVAVIVLTGGGATIYDGDDPSLPMWMTFNDRYGDLLNQNGNQNAIFALNGVLFFVGSGVQYANFVSDGGGGYTTNGQASYLGNLSERSDLKSFSSYSGSKIINNVVYDVAMTVLPNAPIDAATGLPVPTIAVATAGGVSVIKDDGTVSDDTTTAAGFVQFDTSGNLLWGRNTFGGNLYRADPLDYDADWSSTRIGSTASGADIDLMSYSTASSTNVSVSENIWASGSANTSGFTKPGLGLIYLNETDYTKSMQVKATSTYNTGWMNGDIKLATLSDTDDTDVTGSELVTNGTFDTDITGWSDISALFGAGGSAISWDAAGKMSLDCGTSGRAACEQVITTVVGKVYVLDWEPDTATPQLAGRIGTASNGSQIASFDGRSTTYPVTFVAQSTTTYVSINFSVVSTSATFDNISVRLAEPDRSVNGNGLQVYGTITKNPVATGADLVAYSGFSAANYLEQPYNSDLDFGTGDFCVMGLSLIHI